MKYFLVILAVTGLTALSASAATTPSFDSANVCVLIITGSSGHTLASQRTCDGEDMQNLSIKKNMFLEEVSYQLSTLYAGGMRLINCQVNNLGTGLEYLCVVAR